MTTFSPINPSHYLVNPPGIGLECIEYIRHLPHCQATGGKYLYRLGNKDALVQDLDKARWYLGDAQKFDMVQDLRNLKPDLVDTVKCITLRSTIFYFTIIGDIDKALKMTNHVLDYEHELDSTDLTARLKAGSL